MNRGQEITAKLQNLEKAIRELNPLLSSERVQFEMIRGDIEAMDLQKKKLLQENQTIEEANCRATETGEKILATYTEKADELHKAAQERNVESMQLLEKVKEFVKGQDKKMYRELADKVGASGSN